MTLRARPGPAAGADDRRLGLIPLQLPVDELVRIRATALAWRNGLAALLVGLVGFGLVKGRSEIGDLAAPWPYWVGGLLGLALVAGGTAAALLLRAAHGRPGMWRTDDLVAAARHSTGGVEGVEARAAADALSRGVVLSYGCALLLIAAVAVTWYGPADKGPRLVVTTDTTTACGTVEQVRDGVLSLETASGRRDIAFAQAVGLQPVDACPAAAAPAP